MNNKKFRVLVHQENKYRETLEANCESLEDVQSFMKQVFSCCDRVKFVVEVISDEEVEETN